MQDSLEKAAVPAGNEPKPCWNIGSNSPQAMIEKESIRCNANLEEKKLLAASKKQRKLKFDLFKQAENLQTDRPIGGLSAS